MLTLCSISVAAAGLAGESSLLTWVGGGTAGASQMARELIQLLESKYKWVTFLPSASSDRT